MIPVTKSFLPPLDNYNLLVQGIWKRQYITNRGPFNLDLKDNLKIIFKCK